MSAKSAREVSKGSGSGAHGNLESGYTACQMSDFCEPAGRVALSTYLLRTAHAASTGAPYVGSSSDKWEISYGLIGDESFDLRLVYPGVGSIPCCTASVSVVSGLQRAAGRYSYWVSRRCRCGGGITIRGVSSLVWAVGKQGFPGCGVMYSIDCPN